MPTLIEVRPTQGRNDALLELSRDAIAIVDQHLLVRFWSSGAEKLFGVGAREAAGQAWAKLVASEFPQHVADARDAVLSIGHWEGEIQCRDASGRPLHVFSRWEREQAVGSDSDSPLILISSTDMFSLKLEAQAEAEALNRRNFNVLFWHHPDGVLALSRTGKILAANPAFSLLTGRDIGRIIMQPASSLVAPAELPAIRRAFAAALTGAPQSFDLACIGQEGSVDVQLTLLPQIIEDRIVGLHAVLRDISQRRRDERRILYLANHDSLTGLPNRNLLQDRMQHAIEHAHRRHSGLALLFMDLNRFKVINDSLGHDKGDQLLCVIADRLRHAVRESDTVARLGGDEFVVLMEDTGQREQVRQFAADLLDAICHPVDLSGQAVTVSTSIGCAMYPEDGEDPAALLKHADLAMYAAKDAGLGQFRFYDSEMNIKALSQLWREQSLRRAIADGELRLHYQPRLDLATNRLAGVEALVRWEHPEKGLVYPTNFIELAEEIGIIGALGEWVLKSACMQMRYWRDQGMHPIKLSVNVSPLQLHSDRFCDVVRSALANADLEPETLELEITENSLMENIEATTSQLAGLRMLGVSLSIDDFGTGYSSLGYLKRLPIDTLKIDRSFVKDIPDDEDDAAIIRATIALAHSMQLRVVAEGVTNFDQVWMLKDEGCDEIQGYLLCQPLPALEMESYFKTCALRGIQYAWVH